MLKYRLLGYPDAGQRTKLMILINYVKHLKKDRKAKSTKE